jgi:hypothetical protein
MEELNERIAQNKYVRMAGLMYLLVIAVFVTGLFLRSSIETSGTFLDSSHRIASSEHLYRIGISVQLSTMFLALWLAISLYVALRPANRNLALAAFCFGKFFRHSSAFVRPCELSGMRRPRLCRKRCQRDVQFLHPSVLLPPVVISQQVVEKCSKGSKLVK